jgi:hypothetical protein
LATRKLCNTTKEAAAVDDAPAEFDHFGDLRHARPDEVAIARHPNIVERQSEETGAFAAGGLDKCNGEIRFSRVGRCPNRNDRVRTLGAPSFYFSS